MLEDILTTVTVLIRSVSTFNASYLKHFVCCMVVSQYFIDTLCPKKKFTPRFLGYTNNYEGRDSNFHVFCCY